MGVGEFYIEARCQKLVAGLGYHDFWVLYDDKGTPIAELDGYACNRETQEVEVQGMAANQTVRAYQTILIRHIIMA